MRGLHCNRVAKPVSCQFYTYLPDRPMPCTQSQYTLRVPWIRPTPLQVEDGFELFVCTPLSCPSPARIWIFSGHFTKYMPFQAGMRLAKKYNCRVSSVAICRAPE